MSKTWPTFLDRLDDDPDGAFAEFYAYALRVLRTRYPKPLRSVPAGERDDVIHDIIYHCVSSDFAVLRTYQDRGRPFAGWLQVIAHNETVNHLNRTLRQIDTTPIHAVDSDPGLENMLGTDGDSPAKQQSLREFISMVGKALAEIGDRCRTLLEMAANEWTPREMTAVFGVSSDTNKKISDDLRYCRTRLTDLLATWGINVEDYIPKLGRK